jgi:hypothetical protein
MKTIKVNAFYEISSGILKGAFGKVVGFDSRQDEVCIRIDELTSIITTSGNVEEFNNELIDDLFM